VEIDAHSVIYIGKLLRMKFKILSILFIQLSLFIGFTQAQDSRYLEEKIKVLQFFQDSILTDPRNFIIKKSDTILIRKFLWNTNLFKGVSLYSLNSAYENANEHSVFSEQELNSIFSRMTKDTLREKIGYTFKNSIQLVSGDNCIKISKPIFEKAFTYCFLSYGWFNSDNTSIDGSTILLHKRNGKWTLIRKVGDIKSW